MSDNLKIPNKVYDKLDSEILEILSGYTVKDNVKLEFTRTGVTVENLVTGRLNEIFSISYVGKGRVFLTVDMEDGKIQSAYYDKSAFEDIDPCFKKKYKKDISEYLNSLIGLEITFTKREDKKNG